MQYTVLGPTTVMWDLMGFSVGNNSGRWNRFINGSKDLALINGHRMNIQIQKT